MKISHKLIGSLVGVSLLTGVVGAVAIAQSYKIAETLAISESENIAQIIGTTVAGKLQYSQESSAIKNSDHLKNYIKSLHELQKRDISVVNRNKIVIADAVPEEIGIPFNHDKNNEVGQTIQDGKSRIFLEESEAYPQGIKLVVIPLKADQDNILGAVIVEYSSLYDEAIAKARPTMIVIGITSIGCITFSLLVGLLISSNIGKSLQSVTKVAKQVTESSNFDLQVPVTSNDETGILAGALNNLIQRVKSLLIEKEQRSEELQQTLHLLNSTQMQLVQTEKMSSLGQLVAGVAHEINNPVNFIHGNIHHVDSYTQDLLRVVQAYQTHYPNPSQTLQDTLDDVELNFLYEDLAKLLQSMKVGTDRIRQIVLSLRNFSRLDESEFKAVDLHEGIDNTLMILQYRLKAKPESTAIEVIKDYGSLPLVECYPSQLNQVFMNLLANAIDILEESAQESAKIQPGKIWISTAVKSDGLVHIIIADNGAGMPETVRARIFDPFFTTKPIGKGTGLGLSISYKIVTEKHNGKMWCDSELDQGTKFVIEIPIHQLNQTDSQIS